MVFGAEVGLDAFSVGGGARVDVFAGGVGADKGDGFDFRGVEDEVDGFGAAVDYVDDLRPQC